MNDNFSEAADLRSFWPTCLAVMKYRQPNVMYQQQSAVPWHLQDRGPSWEMQQVSYNVPGHIVPLNCYPMSRLQTLKTESELNFPNHFRSIENCLISALFLSGTYKMQYFLPSGNIAKSLWIYRKNPFTSSSLWHPVSSTDTYLFPWE